jgi:hypothetical protein
MKNKTYRYEVLEASGGSYKRFYVWDTKEKRMVKGHIPKFEAVAIEHKLNERKFKKLPEAEEIPVPVTEPTAELTQDDDLHINF